MVAYCFKLFQYWIFIVNAYSWEQCQFIEHSKYIFFPNYFVFLKSEPCNFVNELLFYPQTKQPMSKINDTPLYLFTLVPNSPQDCHMHFRVCLCVLPEKVCPGEWKIGRQSRANDVFTFDALLPGAKVSFS